MFLKRLQTFIHHADACKWINSVWTCTTLVFFTNPSGKNQGPQWLAPDRPVFVQRGDLKCRGPDAVAAAQRSGGAAVRNNVRLPRHRHHTHTGHRVRAKGTPKCNATLYNTLQNHIILSTDNAILAILQLTRLTKINYNYNL